MDSAGSDPAVANHIEEDSFHFRETSWMCRGLHTHRHGWRRSSLSGGDPRARCLGMVAPSLVSIRFRTSSVAGTELGKDARKLSQQREALSAWQIEFVSPDHATLYASWMNEDYRLIPSAAIEPGQVLVNVSCREVFSLREKARLRLDNHAAYRPDLRTWVRICAAIRFLFQGRSNRAALWCS